MTTVAAIKAVLSADTVQFQKRFAAAEAQLTAFKKHAEETGRRLSAIGKKMSMYFTLPATVAAGLAVRSFARYEQALTEVAKNADLTNAELDRMSDKLSDMSIRLGQTNIELAGTAAEIARMGIHGEEAIINLTETLGKLSRTSDIVSEGAKQDFAKLVGITDTAADSVENLASVITMLGQETKAGEAAIVEMARDIAASTKLYDVAATDAAAFASVARDLGLRVRGTGRAFNRVFRRINDFSMAAKAGTKEGLALQRVMGMTSEEIQTLIKTDPSQAFVRLLQGLNRSADATGSLSSTLEDLDLSTERTRQVLELLAKKHEDVADRINRSRGEFEEPIALMKEWERQTETFAYKWSAMQQKIRVAAQEWGKDLIPALEKIVYLFGRMAELIGTLPKWVRVSLETFVALTATLGVLLFVGGKIVAIWGSLAVVFTSVTAAAGALSAALGICVAEALALIAVSTITITVAVVSVVYAGKKIGELVAAIKGYNDQIDETIKKEAEMWEQRRKNRDEWRKGWDDDTEALKRFRSFEFVTDFIKQNKLLSKAVNELGFDAFLELTNEMYLKMLDLQKATTEAMNAPLQEEFKKTFEETNKSLKEQLEDLLARTDAERTLLGMSRKKAELEEKLAKFMEKSGQLTRFQVSQMKELREQFDWIVNLTKTDIAESITSGIEDANIKQTLEDAFGSEASSVYSQLKDLFEQWKELQTLFEGNVPKQFVGVFNQAFKRITGQLTNAMEKTAEKVYPTALEKGTVEEYTMRVMSRTDDIPKQQLKEQKDTNGILGNILNALKADKVPGFTLT